MEKNTKLIGKHCKKYLIELKFEDEKAIFMAVSGMLDLKANYRQKHPKGWNCDMYKNDKEENTQHMYIWMQCIWILTQGIRM